MWSLALYGAKLGQFGKYIRYTLTALKSGAGEGPRRTFEPIV
jgi:hypothetical protein